MYSYYLLKSLLYFFKKWFYNVMKLLKEMQITADRREFGLDCTMDVNIPLSETVKFTEAIEKIEGTKLSDICQKV